MSALGGAALPADNTRLGGVAGIVAWVAMVGLEVLPLLRDGGLRRWLRHRWTTLTADPTPTVPPGTGEHPPASHQPNDIA